MEIFGGKYLVGNFGGKYLVGNFGGSQRNILQQCASSLHVHMYKLVDTILACVMCISQTWPKVINTGHRSSGLDEPPLIALILIITSWCLLVPSVWYGMML